MNYRKAQIADVEQIAQLHADSWRRTYRGLFSDSFLDNDAETDRLQAWSQRLNSPTPQQYVMVAEQNNVLQGFICVYGNDDPRWGSLIDNLHVRHDARRRGIGRQLLQHSFTWLVRHYPDCGVYLWVMANNHGARRFYEQLGAQNVELVDKPNPVGGGSAHNCRYIWVNP
jgi:ribosomal protein S18 acetylase RimI-like enzyme